MPIRRIVVAIDASPGSVEALEAAAGLAETLKAELQGLFVEDVDLLRWSSLPFARQVGTTSGEYRRLDSGQLERQLQAQAAHARATVDATARRFGLHTSFRIARGSVPEELLLNLTGEDVLSISVLRRPERSGHRLGSTARRVVLMGRGRLLLLPPGVRPTSPVAVVVDDSPASVDALEIAVAMVRGRTRDLHLYCVAPSEQAARVLSREATARLGPDGTGAEFRYLEPAAVARVGQFARSLGANTLILPGGTDLVTDERVETIVAEFHGCLLITRVGGSRGA
jgi:nucleotide-binding universal stress UspA family protein